MSALPGGGTVSSLVPGLGGEERDLVQGRGSMSPRAIARRGRSELPQKAAGTFLRLC